MSTSQDDGIWPPPEGERVSTNSDTVVSVRDSLMDTQCDVLASFEALIGPQQARRLRIRQTPSR
jgi:hypothetical protein